MSRIVGFQQPRLLGGCGAFLGGEPGCGAAWQKLFLLEHPRCVIERGDFRDLFVSLGGAKVAELAGGREHAGFDRGDRFVVGVDRSVKASAELDEMLAERCQPFVERLAQVADFFGVAGQSLLAPAERNVPAAG